MCRWVGGFGVVASRGLMGVSLWCKSSVGALGVCRWGLRWSGCVRMVRWWLLAGLVMSRRRSRLGRRLSLILRGGSGRYSFADR
jgi:hypothetical protein